MSSFSYFQPFSRRRENGPMFFVRGYDEWIQKRVTMAQVIWQKNKNEIDTTKLSRLNVSRDILLELIYLIVVILTTA